MLLFVFCFVILLSNVPFGYWRDNVKKFSFQWFLSIHLPVPFIIVGRIYSHMGFQWYTYFFTVSAFFLGQFSGKIIHKKLKEKNAEFVSSFIFTDLYKYLR